MKKPKIVGIIRSYESTMVGNLVLLLLKNNGFKVGLINDTFVKANEDIHILFSNEKDLDYVIIDNLELNFLRDLIKHSRIDALIDDGLVEDEEEYSDISERKKMMFNNLKRNGVSIINSDNKKLFNYFNSLKDKIIITYGLSTKSTITASSLDINETVSFNCCIQRGITTSNGNEIEQMEFPVKVRFYKDFNVSYFLAAIGLALIYEIPIVNIQETIYKFTPDYS